MLKGPMSIYKVSFGGSADLHTELNLSIIMAELPTVQNFITVLRKCRKKKDLGHAKCVHACIRDHGLEAHAALGKLLVMVFVECGSMLDAQEVFNRLSHQSEHSWTSLIQGYTAYGNPEHALNLFRKMEEEGVQQSRFTFLALLRACVKTKCLERGREVHGIIVNKAFDRNSFIGNTLVDMYAKCGSIVEARNVFDKLLARGVVSWNALMTGYAEHKLCVEALNCLEQMRLEGVPQDAVTFVCGLKACGRVGAIDMGRQIYCKVVREGFDQDSFVGSTLVDMHVKCGALGEAHELLDRLSDRDVVSWTALIKGYADHGFGEEALACMDKMRIEGASPNAVTLICGLKACGNIGTVVGGRKIHSEIAQKGLERDSFLGNGLVDMYAKCGSFVEAHQLFGKLPVQTIVSWGALIAGYAEHGLGEEALMWLEEMQLEDMSLDAIAVSSSLRACGSIKNIIKGRELHVLVAEEGFEEDPLVGNDLVDMYAKCGLLAEALEAFEELPSRGVASWTALMAAYVEHDLGEEALNCFEEMQLEGVPPDVVTYVCSLKACASLGAIDGGQEIHFEIMKKGFEKEPLVGNSLVDLYAKCGLLKEAQEVFDKLSVQSVISWTALIAGYAYQGETELTFYMFEDMSEQGVHPNEATFLTVMTVCSHAGLVDEGQKYFEAMSKEYGITPTVMHYNCMVDLLSRAGQLNEAILMLKKMHPQPDLVTWKTLLSACRKWGDIDLGRHAFDCALQLDVEHAVLYKLMYNIYADAHLWAEGEKIKAMRDDIKVWKEPQEICTFVQTFGAGIL